MKNSNLKNMIYNNFQLQVLLESFQEWPLIVQPLEDNSVHQTSWSIQSGSLKIRLTPIIEDLKELKLGSSEKKVHDDFNLKIPLHENDQDQFLQLDIDDVQIP